MEILRRRVDKTTVTETVSKIRDVLTSGMCPVIEDPIRKSTNQALSSLSSSDDEEDGTENDNDNNDDNDVDEISEAYSKSNKTSSITNDSKTVIDNSLNLSGPVTDL